MPVVDQVYITRKSQDTHGFYIVIFNAVVFSSSLEFGLIAEPQQLATLGQP